VARSQESQRQRTQNNPLVLGSFDTTSLKILKRESLGPVNQLVGRADTNQQSNGGFGGGTYNHWFQVNLKTRMLGLLLLNQGQDLITFKLLFTI
jgi:hypothetical protein